MIRNSSAGMGTDYKCDTPYICDTLYIYAFAVIGSLLNTRTSKFYRPCNLFNTY